jgi:hypothetical protein
MAGIWKRGGYWRAEIRRVGYPSQWRTFDTRAEAEAWARRIESEMDRGTFVDRTEAERNTFGDLLERYAEEVSPHKKGAAEERLRFLPRPTAAQGSLATTGYARKRCALPK